MASVSVYHVTRRTNGKIKHAQRYPAAPLSQGVYYLVDSGDKLSVYPQGAGRPAALPYQLHPQVSKPGRPTRGTWHLESPALLQEITHSITSKLLTTGVAAVLSQHDLHAISLVLKRALPAKYRVVI